MTFYVKTDYPEFTKELCNELEKYGLQRSNKFPVSIVFLSGEASYYRNKIDLKQSVLANTIWSIPITNKIELHKLFDGFDFIKKFDIIKKRIPILPSHFLKILKPLGGFQGTGITLVESPDEVENWISKHDYDEWLLQDYIQTPALKDGYKFHLRVPILVVRGNVYVCNKSPYYLAKQQYVQSDWKNRQIHDTHFSESKYFYPQDLPDDWKYSKHIGTIFKTVFQDVKLRTGWNGKTPYYLFGADVMFDDRKPILLEVNEKIGLKEMDFVIPGMVSILLGKEHPDFVKWI